MKNGLSHHLQEFQFHIYSTKTTNITWEHITDQHTNFLTNECNHLVDWVQDEVDEGTGQHSVLGSSTGLGELVGLGVKEPRKE